MDPAAVAFGRYLRSLRERRGLSLPQVSVLSAATPKPVDKGTLSRLERGLQRPGVSVLIPLCRIYTVSADALLERLELDVELEHVGAPPTEGHDAAELRRLGRSALVQHNRKWDAYAYFREALRAAEDEILRDATPEAARARAAAALNLATVIRSLGRNRLALHELAELERSRAAGEREHALVLDRISNCHRCLGELGPARVYADAAIDESLRVDEPRTTAFALFSRASVAFDEGETEQGIGYLSRAFRVHRETAEAPGTIPANPTFEVNALVRLSEAYFGAGAYERAGRAALAARRIAVRHELPAGRAYAELYLGRLDEHAGERERAVRRWRWVADQAARLHNERLGFSAEYFIYRNALAEGQRALARASQQRLERLAPWVPAHLPLLAEFRERARFPDPGPPPSRGAPKPGGKRRCHELRSSS